MSDQELIAYLKRQGLDKDVAAADRIEELVKERDGYLAERNKFQLYLQRTHADWELEVAAVEALTAKLAKAVGALRASLEGLNWAKAYLSTSRIDSVQVNYADEKVYAVLAELEGK